MQCKLRWDVKRFANISIIDFQGPYMNIWSPLPVRASRFSSFSITSQWGNFETSTFPLVHNRSLCFFRSCVVLQGSYWAHRDNSTSRLAKSSSGPSTRLKWWLRGLSYTLNSFLLSIFTNHCNFSLRLSIIAFPFQASIHINTKSACFKGRTYLADDPMCIVSISIIITRRFTEQF